MKILDRVTGTGKKTAVAAGTTFALTNPLLTTFALGVGIVVWLSLRRRSQGGR